MNATFSREIIGELKARLVKHNNVVTDPAQEMRLGPIKALYKRWYNGADPHVHAMTKIDEHLAGLRGEELEKARRPFNSGRHPRGRAGQFRTTGGSRSVNVRQVGLVNRSHAVIHDEDNPASPDYVPVGVIPETRYSVLGPGIAATAGVGLGMAQGATARFKGSGLDRLATKAAGEIGAGAGWLAGAMTGIVGITGPRAAARGIAGAANRRFGMAIPMLSETAGKDAAAALRAGGVKVGRMAGHTVGHLSALSTNAVPAAVRMGAEHFLGSGVRGRLISGAAGALVGGTTGAFVYSPMFRHFQEKVGPYEDALFPRRVRKMAGPLFDSPEVLAKMAELMDDEELAKANFGAIARGAGTVAQSVLRRLRLRLPARGVAAPIAGARAAAGRAVRPSRYGPPTLADVSREANATRRATATAARREVVGAVVRPETEKVFERFRTAPAVTPPAVDGMPPPIARAAGFHVGRGIGGRVRIAGARGLALAGAGAGLGALTGVALGAFNEKHPREKTGRFAHKGTGAVTGAKIGAAVGLGLGIATGLATARRGQGALVASALARLQGAELVGGRKLPEVMRAETRAVADRTHTSAWLANTANQRKVPNFNVPPGSPIEGRLLADSLKQHAIERFKAEEGKAIGLGARNWLQHQLDTKFDTHVWRELTKINTDLKSKGLPVLVIPGKSAATKITASTTNLINNIDAEALTAPQRKIWDDAVKRRAGTLAEIDRLYAPRTAARVAAVTAKAEKEAEYTRLNDLLEGTADQESVAGQWHDLRQDGKLAQLRDFAKTHFNFDLPDSIKSDRLPAPPAPEVPTGRPSAAAMRTYREALVQHQDALEQHQRLTESDHQHAVLAIDHQLNVWQDATKKTVAALKREIDSKGPLTAAVEKATAHEAEDLTPAELADKAMLNPFATGKDAILQARPDITAAAKAHGDEVAKPFEKENIEHQDIAEEHLNELIATHEAALQARIPKASMIAAAFPKVVGPIAGRWHQARIDAAEMLNAHRESLTGFPKWIEDQLHLNKNPTAAWESTKKVSKSIGARGKQVGAFALKHWQLISGVVGPLTALGIVDLSAPSGKRYKVNPKNWKIKGIGIVNERPNSILRPHEAIVGLSFEGPGGQRKFLHGAHIYRKPGATEASVHHIAFGSDVQEIRNTVRNLNNPGGGNNNNTRADPINVKNQQEFTARTQKLREAGEIDQVGPPGFKFAQRTGGDGGKEENEWRENFYKRHLEKFEDFAFKPGGPRERTSGLSTKHAEPYFASLKALFEDRNGGVVGQAARVGLLVGSGKRRGIFANQGGPYKGGNVAAADKEEVTKELIRQLAEQGHLPRTDEQYSLLHRATWLVANHYGLDDDKQSRILKVLNKHYRDANGGKNPPVGSSPFANVDTSAADQVLSGQVLPPWESDNEQSHQAHIDYLVASVPSHLRPPGRLQNDLDLKNLLSETYAFAYQRHLNDHNSPEAARDHARTETTAAFDRLLPGLRRSEEVGDLRKFGFSEQSKPRPSKIPGIAGASMAPKLPAITGAAAAKTPAIAGAARPAQDNSIGHDIAQSLKPARAVSQFSMYGLSQAGFTAASHLASKIAPFEAAGAKALRVANPMFSAARHAGILSRIGRGVTRNVIGGVGGVIAGNAGSMIGTAMGDHPKGQSPAHALERTAGGVAAQLAVGEWAIPKLLTAFAPRLAGAAVGAATGGAEGAAVGTAAGPMGSLAGMAIGTVGGGIAAYLADEGIGILQRHLSRYGAHVPKTVTHRIIHGKSGPPPVTQGVRRLVPGYA